MNDNEFLQHFGIPGMRWGRKKSSGGASSEKTNASDDHNKVESLKSKKVHEMSNDELRAFTQRIQLERQYKELTRKPVHPVKKFVRELLVNAGKQAAKQAVDAQTKKLVEEMLKKKAQEAAKSTAKKTVKRAIGFRS